MDPQTPYSLSIIAALAGETRVIGKEGALPWNIKEDLEHFKNITSGHAVIMGRKTFESIGHPLSKRINVVITRDISFSAEGIIVAYSLDDAIEKAVQKMDPTKKEIFIIGGEQVYTEALPYASKLYLTLIHEEIEGDTFFPDISGFGEITSEEHIRSGKHTYSFVEIERSYNPTGKLF